MDNTDVEKTSYGALERFIYLILIPLIFTSILIGVMFAIFNFDVKNSLLKTANEIPLIRSIVPDPEAPSTDQNQIGSGATLSVEEQEALLNQKEQELTEAIETIKQKDIEIQELNKEITQLQTGMEHEKLSDEAYVQKIQQLAKTYGEMSPSKAAPILQNLTMPELVLVLDQMKLNDQVKVLEKMNPEVAAEASILLKDVVPVKDQAIQALQARLALNELTDQEDQPANLTIEELARTFAGMNADIAAAALLEMNAAEEAKVLNILRLIDLQSRSAIFSAMIEASKEEAASIMSKLGE